MKKVYVSILERPPPNLFKLKVTAAMKGSNFKDYIRREIVNLTDVDFFFIYYDKEQRPMFLDDTKAFSSMPDQKLRFRLVVRNQTINLRTAVGKEKPVTFDMQKTCNENIISLGLENPDHYILTFKPKGAIHPKIAAKKVQLVFQGWKGETVTLHRRISRQEYTDTSTENLKKLYSTCRLYAADNLVYFKRNMWGLICAYLYLSEAKDGSEFKKKTMEKMLPEGLQPNDQMLKIAQDTIRQSMFLSSQEAAKNYVDHFIRHGTLCCHVEEVKFLLVDKKWRMQSNRCIYISSQRFLVTKDFYGEIVQSESISNIASVACDKERVIINIQGTKQWVLRTENAELLKYIIDDQIEIGKLFNPKNYRLSAQWEPSDIAEVSLALEASKIIENAAQPESHIVQPEHLAIQPESHVTQPESHVAQPESYVNTQEEEESSKNTNVFIKTGSVRLSRYRDREAVPGISPIVPPEEGKENTPYSITDQCFRDLKVLKELILPEREIAVEEREVPNISNFAMYNNLDVQKKFMLLSSVLVVVFILFIKNL
jgi:hypothetical protein